LQTVEIPVGIRQHQAGVVLVLAAWGLIFSVHARAAESALLPGLLIVTLYGAHAICGRTGIGDVMGNARSAAECRRG